MKTLVAISFTVIGFWFPQACLAEYVGETRCPKFISFRLFYPMPSTSSNQLSIERPTGIGVDFTYQYYYLGGRVGFDFSPGAWFVRVKDQSGNTETLFSMMMTGGLALRVLPETFMDPSILVNGGISLTDVGDFGKARFNYPILSRFIVSLYRTTSRYKDPSLSLTASSTYYYYFDQIATLDAGVFDVGLALKGSF